LTQYISKEGLTYIDELDAILLYGIQGDGDVLQGVGLGLGCAVVPQFPSLQHLHQRHQPAVRRKYELHVNCCGYW
jgi:hypothetical protein